MFLFLLNLTHWSRIKSGSFFQKSLSSFTSGLNYSSFQSKYTNMEKFKSQVLKCQVLQENNLQVTENAGELSNTTADWWPLSSTIVRPIAIGIIVVIVIIWSQITIYIFAIFIITKQYNFSPNNIVCRVFSSTRNYSVTALHHNGNITTLNILLSQRTSFLQADSLRTSSNLNQIFLMPIKYS